MAIPKSYVPKRKVRPGMFWRRLFSGNPTDIQLGILLLSPAFLILGLVMFYPVINVFYQSLRDVSLVGPSEGFIGTENFQRIFGMRMAATWTLSSLWLWRLLGLAALIPLWLLHKRGHLNKLSIWFWTGLVVLVCAWLMGYQPDESVRGARWADARFWNALNVTLLIIVVSVVGSFLVGLPLALLANINSPLRWLVRIALLLPWAMPRVFTGLTFAWLFQSDYGVINDLLGRIGVNSIFQTTLPEQWVGNNGIFWLARVTPAVVATNITIIWKTSSFVGLMLLAGLQSIDESLYEAATVDGANPRQRFWYVTLPLLRPAIAVALIFRTLTAVQTFDIPYAMTQGGPGRSLQTLGFYIQNLATSSIGYAAALSVVLFAISFVITVVYLRWVYDE
jgi:multiple sugar transport system permease protein